MSSRSAPLLARIRGMALGARLALLGAIVTAGVVGGTFVVLRRATEADVRRAFVNELGASQVVMHSVKSENQKLLLQTALLLANSPTLKAALEVGRTERNTPAMRQAFVATVQNEAAKVFSDFRQELWVVTDDSGRVTASGGGPDAPATGTSFANVPVIRSALGFDSTTGSLQGVHRQGYAALHVGAAPVVVNGYAVGAVMLGARIIVPHADSASDIQMVVVAGDTVLVSTLAGLRPDDRVPADWARVSAALPERWLGGEEYVAVRLPLGLADDGQHTDLYLMRSVSHALGPILSGLTRRFVLLGALAVVLVGAGSAATSRVTLRPLARFVTLMRTEAGAKGYAQFEQRGAAAEITLLTRAYNRLIASLQRGHEQLQQRTDELAIANEHLQRQVLERVRAEQALRESEEQLRQSQKLEALGALAGGVAHDFNNILSIILGYAEIVQGELPEGSAQHTDVTKISDAAVRARALVRQLLAFSRKQVLQPQVLNLSRVVTDVQPLLRPLLGEDVLLDVKLNADVSSVMADPGQIEQVILNLVVNARDAMPNGGHLLIETADVVLEPASTNLPLPGGPVVMLAVTDTGIGMDAATRTRIFEPFFTTKPVGKGTGLGLATVYGIVRQSEGNITVFSEPGIGTTFRCYFPAVIAGREQEDAPAMPAARPRGAETILLAEDEYELRHLLRRVLQSQGYNVLEAANGIEALEIARNHDGPIQLLATDVIMPHLSGKELAEQLSAERPGMRVLFMSGYSDEAIDRHGMLTPDSTFLQKPVLPEALARAVRELLDDAIPAGVS